MKSRSTCLLPLLLLTVPTNSHSQKPLPNDAQGQIQQEIRSAESSGKMGDATNLQGALEEERRREAEKADGMRIATADDRARIRAAYYPDFLKDVREFSHITQSIVPSDPASVRKQLKKLEKNASNLLRFLLQGEKAPQVAIGDAGTIENLVALVKPIRQSLHEYQSKPNVINAPNYVELLQNLQTLKLISHSLAK